MKISKLTGYLLLAVIAVGCQKGSDVTTAIDPQLDSGALANISCQSGDSGLSISEAKILGADNLVPDKTTVLSLESNVNCSQAEKAQWSVGNLPLGQGAQVQAKIKGSGVYYIKVNSASHSSQSAGTPSANKATVTSISENSVRVSLTKDITLTGTQVGVEFNSYTFALDIPNGVTLKSADWNFGGSVPIRHSLTSESKSFAIGTHTFSVVVTDSNDKVTTLNHTITVLPISAGIDCTASELATLEVTGSSQVPKGEAYDYSLNQPECIQNSISKIAWNFGDGSAVANTAQVEHTYAAKGDYVMSVSVWLNQAASPSFSISRSINVQDVMEEFPGPVTPPINPNACAVAGSTRTVDGSASTKEVACGLNGKRTDNYKEQIVQICQMTSGSLSWVEQSKTVVLVSEGTCQNQSCTLAGQPAIAHGQTVKFYTSQAPTNSCESVQVSRTCTNGILSGSQNAVYATCQNGCGDFGANGTVKTGLVVGSISTPVVCQYGEAGIYDVYLQIADKTCVNGNVITSNTRQGESKEKGSCPAYNWYPTDAYTSCSANCGGQQKLIYACRDNHGVTSDLNRCGGSSPVSERVCDGSPEAVRQSTTTTAQEEANSSVTCPKNQIGVIVKDRTVSTTVVMACIDHKVQEASRTVVNSDWISTSYCRDLVPMRCSQDSLSNTEAQGRYDWMVKCQNQVPVIKEFLENFENVKYNGISLDDSTRHLYPTFLDSATKKPWIAPKTSNGSCTVPAKAYVAAVCVSSCATPEQEIMAEVEKGKALRKISFIEAWAQNLKKVGTLHPYSTIDSTKLEQTEVEHWVTELLDTTQPVLTFKLRSGGQLRVTPNHPILNQDGAMQEARAFKVNDNFVRLGGRLDKIVSIDQSDYYGKVYNVFVNSNELKKNVIVINDYLSGTAFYQNEGAQYMNRELFRNNLTRGAFDK